MAKKNASFIKNTWYVAAEAQELTHEKPLARTLLNEKVVFFRTSNGTAVAFKDACPHRFAPLHRGRIEGDCLRCPYHGALYNEEGRCVQVPGQAEGDKFGMNQQLTKYPVIERYQYIWIWMGDPTLRGDERSIPTWFSPADPDSREWKGRHDKMLSFPAYYELVNDNLHDVTHTEFVHPETLGASLMPHLFRTPKENHDENNFMKKKIGERTLELEFHRNDVHAGEMFHSMVAYQRRLESWDDNVDWHLTVKYSTPSYFSFHPRTKAVGDAEDNFIQFNSLNAITPESDTSCHYFFYTANNLKSTPEREAEFTEMIADGIVFAFNQDKALISEQMLRVPDKGKVTESLTQVSFSGDSVPIIARKMIRKQIAEEVKK